MVIFRGEEVTGSRRLCKYSHIVSLHLELTQDGSVKPCVKKLRAAAEKRRFTGDFSSFLEERLRARSLLTTHLAFLISRTDFCVD